MAVCNSHDLGTFAPLGFADLKPPFFAGTNVPLIKHSCRSSPPRSSRSRANAPNSRSMAPASPIPGNADEPSGTLHIVSEDLSTERQCVESTKLRLRLPWGRSKAVLVGLPEWGRLEGWSL
jgi:hypothetical protein